MVKIEKYTSSWGKCCFQSN